MIIPAKYRNRSASKLLLSYNRYEMKTVKHWNDDNNKTLLSLYLLWPLIYLKTTCNCFKDQIIQNYVKCFKSKSDILGSSHCVCLVLRLMYSFCPSEQIISSHPSGRSSDSRILSSSFS